MIKIYGASDDLIEVEGDISEEFDVHAYNEEDNLLGFSDGIILKLSFDKDGIWRIVRLVKGRSEYTLEQGDVLQDTNDVATLEGDIEWVLHGHTYGK